MTFLTPLLLSGIALIGVPIALHLARRREPRRWAFPALRLLEKTRKRQETHLRLRRLLLLALRCAAIALLSIALARPIFAPSQANSSAGAPNANADATGLAMAMVFDNGANAAYRSAGQTRLEVAQEAADWMLGQTPAETEVVVADRTLGARPSVADAGVAASRVKRLATTAATRPLTDAVAAALQSLAQASAGRREAYVFTDLSTGALGAEAPAALSRLLESHPGVTLRLVDVGAATPRNGGIAGLDTPSTTLLVGQPLRLVAAVRFVGEPPADAMLRVFVNGDDGPVKRDERPLPLASGDAAEGDSAPRNESRANFTIRGLGEGTHTGFVQLVTADGLPGDDVRYFAVRVVEPPTVWLVANDTASAVFVREAVSATQSAAGVACRTILTREFGSDRRLARLDPAEVAAVVLLDPPPLRSAVWRRLADYAAAGGGVGLALGREATLDAVNAGDAQALLPATLRWRSRERTYLSPADYRHPAIAPLAPYGASLPWSAFPVLERWDVDRLAGDAEVVVAYADGAPAIVARPLGRGRVLMMTTPLSDRLGGPTPPWNLLPTGDDPWPFLLLAQSLVDYLTSGTANPLQYAAGSPATVALAAGSATSNYLVRLPSGDAVRRTPPPGATSLAVRLTESPGVYRVATAAEGRRFESSFVVNVPAEAGDLTRLDAAALIEAVGNDRLEIVDDREALAESIDRGRIGRELYGWVLALVVAAIAGEQVVANRFYRTGGGAAE